MIFKDAHQPHGILFAGDDSDNELEIDEGESGDEDDGQFDDADEENEATGPESDGTQSPLKHIYQRNEKSTMSIQMKVLGLMPSRPRPSTFPYISTEPQETTVPAITHDENIPKTDSVAILSARPQIQIDLASSTSSNDFNIDYQTTNSSPLLAQPQSGSQERYYFSSAVTSSCVTPAQQSFGGDAKVAADVIALTHVTMPSSTTQQAIHSISASRDTIVTTTASMSLQPTTCSVSDQVPSSLILSSVENYSSNAMPGSVSIFKTSSPPNQHIGSMRLQSPNNDTPVLIKDQKRDSLSPGSESYYLDRASVLTARSQHYSQANFKRNLSNATLGGSTHDQVEQRTPPQLHAYLQERAVLQAARSYNPVDGIDNKPPDNVVAPSNNHPRIHTNKDKSVNNNLEKTCQAIMEQSNSTMHVPQGGKVVVLDKIHQKSNMSMASPTHPNFGLAPLESLQKPRDASQIISKANSPTPSSNALFKQDSTYAPRNVTMNVNDMPSITSSNTVHHHPLPPNVQLAANAATASSASTNASFPSTSIANSTIVNGSPTQASTSRNSTSAHDQNSNTHHRPSLDGVSPAKRIKLEGSQIGTPTKSGEGSGAGNRTNEAGMSSLTTAGDHRDANSSDTGRAAEFTEICTTNEEGKPKCGFCSKVFQKQSQLRLHVNIHYFERPFRCDACAVSFRTKGHLQKHKRSTGHYNKVNINATFGTPSNTNPRPFKCTDCKVAFRIHGHLAKHLRSKMHIMKLECSGKLPIGMFAEMERLGTNLNEIDTKDCDRSLESLQEIAVKLYNNDPSKLTNTEDVQNVQGGNHSDVSDNEDTNEIEIKEEPADLHQSKPIDYHNTASTSISSQTSATQQRQLHEFPKGYGNYDVKRHNSIPNEQYLPHHPSPVNRAPISHGSALQPSSHPNYLPANHLSQSVTLVPPPNQQIRPPQLNNPPQVHVISPNEPTPSLAHHSRIRIPHNALPNSHTQISGHTAINTSSVVSAEASDQPRSASVTSSHLSQDDVSTTDSEPVSITDDMREWRRVVKSVC